jgi:hypothetical protein
MKYSKEAYQYLESEHIRLLIREDKKERSPSIEERVLEAFDAGMKTVDRSYSNLDCFTSNKGQINFPRVTL